MESKSKKLRSGFTTGACAAAAAKAATLLLLGSESGVRSSEKINNVEIPFPDGSRVQFGVWSSEFGVEEGRAVARVSVIKDAGDDPDVTNGAEILATVRSSEFGVRSMANPEIRILGGKGVGVVTKPGLAIPVGEPAINPIPRRMIIDAVREAVMESVINTPNSELQTRNYEVTISVPAGEELAKKTLNHRLGILGGISILGTTGIVKPLSEAAWTATISASFNVAKALGLTEVVVSTGRTSERAHQNRYHLPVEAYAMMGDYTEYSLRDAKNHGFNKVHLCAQWAKMIKIAMAIPQTHVRHGALEAEHAKEFLTGLGISLPKDRLFNTSREIYEFIRSNTADPRSALMRVCEAARSYCEGVAEGVLVSVHLVSYEGAIVADCK